MEEHGHDYALFLWRPVEAKGCKSFGLHISNYAMKAFSYLETKLGVRAGWIYKCFGLKTAVENFDRETENIAVRNRNSKYARYYV